MTKMTDNNEYLLVLKRWKRPIVRPLRIGLGIVAVFGYLLVLPGCETEIVSGTRQIKRGSTQHIHSALKGARISRYTYPSSAAKKSMSW